MVTLHRPLEKFLRTTMAIFTLLVSFEVWPSKAIQLTKYELKTKQNNYEYDDTTVLEYLLQNC